MYTVERATGRGWYFAGEFVNYNDAIAYTERWAGEFRILDSRGGVIYVSPVRVS